MLRPGLMESLSSFSVEIVVGKCRFSTLAKLSGAFCRLVTILAVNWNHSVESTHSMDLLKHARQSNRNMSGQSVSLSSRIDGR